jgi:aryl-alcohol dehydrogenase-like predicted oxidoreductase
MKSKYDRREFLVKPAQWVAAAGLVRALDLPLAAQAAAKPIMRPLGKTGITLPVVSMGVMNADSPGLLRRSYEVGIRHFDTAAAYQMGRNETMVGNVVRELGVRNDVTIATKIWLRMLGSPTEDAEIKAKFRQAVEDSLRRLQMDHVDILYNHGLDTAAGTTRDEPLNTLQALKKEGKTRNIGVSTHMGQAEVLDAARGTGVYDVVLVSFNYTMANNTALLEAISRASKAGIGLVAMKTQAGGGMRPDRTATPPIPANHPALLKWVLRHTEVATAIPGYTTYEQMEQNFSVASNLELSPTESEYLSGRRAAASLQFCHQCAQCRPDCPRKADIPALMRAHMYAVQYGNYAQAASTLAMIRAGQGLDACHKCTECSATCRNSVNIAGKIGVLKQLSAIA